MNPAEPPLSAFPHDAAYKAMYGHPEAIAGLRPYLVQPNGPLAQETLDAIDFERLERLPAEWVTKDFLRRYGDQVWRVPLKAAGGNGSPTRWLIIMLEFQSEADAGMTLRVLGYVWELWRAMEAQGALTPDAPRPLMLPVVIHNGDALWRAPRRLADWTLAGLPQGLHSDLAPLQPSVGLHVVDFAAHRGDDLIMGSLTSLQIGIEHAGPSDFARLLPALAELPGARLRRTVYDWVRLRARHHFRLDLEPLEDEDMSVGAFRSRIDENMKRATEAWYNDGLNQGLERQRALLRRQIAAKFGDSAAAGLAALIAQTADWETLGNLGELVVQAGDEPQLLARAQAVVAESA